MEVLLARSLKRLKRVRADEQTSPQEPLSGVQGEGALAEIKGEKTLHAKIGELTRGSDFLEGRSQKRVF